MKNATANLSLALRRGAHANAYRQRENEGLNDCLVFSSLPSTLCASSLEHCSWHLTRNYFVFHLSITKKQAQQYCCIVKCSLYFFLSSLFTNLIGIILSIVHARCMGGFLFIVSPYFNFVQQASPPLDWHPFVDADL